MQHIGTDNILSMYTFWLTDTVNDLYKINPWSLPYRYKKIHSIELGLEEGRGKTEDLNFFLDISNASLMISKWNAV